MSDALAPLFNTAGFEVHTFVSSDDVERQIEKLTGYHPEEWIADMAEDPERVWRSPWLTVCARHAAEL